MCCDGPEVERKTSFLLTSRGHGLARRSLGRTVGWSRSPSPQRVSTDTCQGVDGKSQRDTLHSATRVDGESWPPRKPTPILMWASVLQGRSGRGDKVDAASCSSISTRRVVSCFLHSIHLILGLVAISGRALEALGARFISLLLLVDSLLRCIIINLFLSPGWFWFPSQPSLHTHAKQHQEIVNHPPGSLPNQPWPLADRQDAEPQHQRAQPRLVCSRYAFALTLERGIGREEVQT